MNVEICFSVKSIKYVIKGNDQAVFEVSHNDEIAQYLLGRYIGPSEAVAQILGFPVHEREPNVIRLQVHLPGNQRVIVMQNKNVHPRGDNEVFGNTTLTEFFNLCARNPFAKTLLYH